MTESLSDLQVAAALSEMIYRRNAADQAIAFTNIPTSGNDPSVIRPPSLVKDPSGFYYDDATGFVGQVVDANDKIFVVFRGTDFEGGLTGVDFTDGNLPLALGTFNNAQLDDAIALTKAAIAAATAREALNKGLAISTGS
jgi:hypothetical protein